MRPTPGLRGVGADVLGPGVDRFDPKLLGGVGIEYLALPPVAPSKSLLVLTAPRAKDTAEPRVDEPDFVPLADVEAAGVLLVRNDDRL